MSGKVLTAEQAAVFQQDGYLFVKDLYEAEEIELLRKISKADSQLVKDSIDRLDSQSGNTKLTLRNDLSDDIYSAYARGERMVGAVEQLLEGEVYHYHHKMTIKEPFVGGAWEWHQDYGYWYNNGCLFPYMASCMIAVDKATRENGCLQVLRGSHHMGRIEHGLSGEQTGADMERVEKAMERLELVYCEMEPGTALFFHCNLLHRSDQNRSPDPRWALIVCYNAARNDPYKKHGHPNYSFLERWPDSKIKEIGHRDDARKI